MRLSGLSCLLLYLSLSAAKNSPGDIAVTINGVTTNPTGDDDVRMQNVNPGTTILVRGLHVRLDIDVPTMAVNNYILTGFPDDLRLVTSPTVILLTRKPIVTSPFTNIKLDEVRIRLDKLELRFTTNFGKLKFQILDSPQGGDLQVEPEFAIPSQLIQVLGPSLFYFINPNTGSVNFGNGIDAVSQSQDPVNFHLMLLGKDSLQAATKTLQTGNTTMFTVQPGGRVGLVFGEDALEPGVPNNCTSKCQNQDRIQGSIPIPPDPTSFPPVPRK